MTLHNYIGRFIVTRSRGGSYYYYSWRDFAYSRLTAWHQRFERLA